MADQHVLDAGITEPGASIKSASKKTRPPSFGSLGLEEGGNYFTDGGHPSCPVLLRIYGTPPVCYRRNIRVFGASSIGRTPVSDVTTLHGGLHWPCYARPCSVSA